MRLINTTTFEFKEFFSGIPPYAILSHTWGTEDGSEVTFRQWLERNASPITSAGLAKILKSCEIAAAEGLQYVWVDTCCIDKSSSAELTEAINSMFMWYHRAHVCYVYLEDLPSFPAGYDGQIDAWKPDNAWRTIGTKLRLRRQLEEITSINSRVLDGRTPPGVICVAEKMSWAARRTTTRKEDMAYCLLGLFGVNMPLLYGEEDNAFLRLQEHIIQKTNDLSIFTWSPSCPVARREVDVARGCLAESPADFASCNSMSRRDTFGMMEPEFVMTNKGIRLETSRDLVYTTVSPVGGESRTSYILRLGCYSGLQNAVEIVVPLQKWGRDIFARDPSRPNTFNKVDYVEKPAFEKRQTIYLIVSLPAFTSIRQSHTLLPLFQRAASCMAVLHIDPIACPGVMAYVYNRWPSNHFDAERNLFMAPVGMLGKQWTACRFHVSPADFSDAGSLGDEYVRLPAVFYLVVIWSIRSSPTNEATNEEDFSYLLLERPAWEQDFETDAISELLTEVADNFKSSYNLQKALAIHTDAGRDWNRSLTIVRTVGRRKQHLSIDCTRRVEYDSRVCLGPIWRVSINFEAEEAY
ncbi:HET domain-containing protein [Verticillium alfalfae VaMs.102]|uniref:HET domain-containing protein n=1 Tax=Verticillium alfalfae (strain VaMs.102 / ATCC MYA-4576 / FGSC 10136) TaxID=526221 RepID=C9SMY4_VERA1|nr:HET domain-containing protein [Verticillium alfalfae VaMs.102]EEY20149.1 HET domain-containing protein [Verticillium alfalfae VaMs.102]